MLICHCFDGCSSQPRRLINDMSKKEINYRTSLVKTQCNLRSIHPRSLKVQSLPYPSNLNRFLKQFTNTRIIICESRQSIESPSLDLFSLSITSCLFPLVFHYDNFSISFFSIYIADKARYERSARDIMKSCVEIVDYGTRWPVYSDKCYCY